MNFQVAYLSDRGPRPENEDSVEFAEIGFRTVALAVADGLGGHFGGQVASRLAVNEFIKMTAEGSTNLGQVAEHIHSKIKAEQMASPKYRTMASTLSAAVLRPGLMEFVHCGDTRISVARANGIRRLTTDHSEAERLFASGAITKEQRANYPRKNILESALGIQGTPKIDTGIFQLQLGDKLFFSTDGFHNKVLLRELFTLCSKWRSATAAIGDLKQIMNDRKADDNYSVACVFVVP